MNRDGYVSMTDTEALTNGNGIGIGGNGIGIAHDNYYHHHFMNDQDSMNSGDNCMIMDDISSDENECELIEHDDHIEVNGVVIHKPFVEKVR